MSNVHLHNSHNNKYHNTFSAAKTVQIGYLSNVHRVHLSKCRVVRQILKLTIGKRFILSLVPYNYDIIVQNNPGNFKNMQKEWDVNLISSSPHKSHRGNPLNLRARLVLVSWYCIPYLGPPELVFDGYNGLYPKSS